MQPLFDLVADPVYHAAPAPKKSVRTGYFLWRALNYLINSVLRLITFTIYMLMQRPLGTPLAMFCVYLSFSVGANLMGQGKPHPSPLFAGKQQVAAKTLPSLPAKIFQASYEQPDEGVDIRAAQTRLAELGIYKGALDGRMGPKTAEAIRSFQMRSGLAATGAIDMQLMARLQDSDQPAAYESDNILIFTVQHRLNELGYDAGGASGHLTPKTQAAIRKFEAEHNLPVTGAIRGLLLSALTSARLAAKQ